MKTCNVCWAWQPKQWENSRWVDKEARCVKHNKMVGAEETCEHCSILPPTLSKETVAHKTVTTIEKDTAPELYSHQQEAFDRFKDKSEICLFFEMGCGKSATILIIAAEKFKNKEIDGLLIVAPNDVHKQWADEQIPAWLDCEYQCQCLFGRGGQKVAYAFDSNDESLQIVCVNIDTFSTPNKWKDIVDWGLSRKLMIVLDEATVIKNPSAMRTQRLLYEFNDVVRRRKTVISSIPKTAARAVLTGTPVTNGPMDLWAIMEFIRPNFFNRNYYSFQAHFGMFTSINVNGRNIAVALTEETWTAVKGINDYREANYLFGVSLDTFNVIHSQDNYQGPFKNVDELKKLLEPVSMFKKLVDCVDMPEQQYIKRSLRMSDEQRMCYNDMVSDFIAQYDNYMSTALNKITAMIRLQQISSGFIYGQDITYNEDMDILPSEVRWIGKSNPKLDALYNDIAELDKPLIIVTHFSAEAGRIYDDLKDKYSCCLMTGWKRVGTIEEFKEGKYQIMIANSTVISKGFNLQNANKILFYSNTFSLETRLQTEGRIFRIGQKNICTYIDYAFIDTVDERIIAALRLKRNLLEYIRGEDDLFTKA